MQVGGAEIKGSIYAITSDEGAYAQVPWLEDGEIHFVNSMRTCILCQKSQEKGKGIAWRGEKYFFCSYAHYLDWRNQQIQEHHIDAEIMDEEFLRYFNDFRELKIIEENTTSEQRQKALNRALRKKFWNFLRNTLIWLAVIACAFTIYNLIFG